MGSLNGNPNFPLLRVRDAKQPDLDWLLVLDARNGKPTWDTGEDPTIIRIAFRNGEIVQIEVDEGFLRDGKTNRNLQPYEGNDAELFRRVKPFTFTSL